jgi:hypothetical protein
LPVSRTFYNVSLKFLIRVLLRKEILPFSKALGKERLPHVLQKGPLWKQTPISEPYLAYSSGFPIKEPSLEVALIKCTV